MDEQELFKLKKQIDEAKSKVSELKGQQKHLMKQLKDEWDCTSIEAAEKKAKTIEKEINDLNQKITEGIEELEEKYDV